MADSVLQSPTNPHFFQPLLHDFNSHLSIPVTFFSKHIQGRNEYKTAKLRSDASDIAWEVEIDDGRRLTGGWKEFVTAHDFRIGDVIVFRHEGDLLFHVTALGPSCCEIEYTSSHNIDDDSDDHHDNKIEIKPKKKKVKKNPRTEEDSSSSDTSCFVAKVSASNLYDDKVYVPINFARANGLSKSYGKIILLNEKGRSWKLSLDHDKAGLKTFLRHGWRSFCNANGMNEGHFTFKLVQNSETPVLRLCQAGYRPDSESSSCFMGCVTPSSLRKDAQYLPRKFVSSNCLKRRCHEMVLKNEYGETWNLVLRHNKVKNITFISCGWRRFCQVNGLKARDYFKFNLVRTGDKPVLCLCPDETNLDARLEECPEDHCVHSLSTNPSSGEESSETEVSGEKKSIEDKGKDIIVKEESEEESFEDKTSLRECLNIEKWKHCSRFGASSSQSQYRFATLTVTPYTLRSNKLRLPLCFTRANGIVKSGNITLLGQDGVKRMVRLAQDNKNGRMRLGRDWKRFCEDHDVRVGESFELELIRENDANPVLKFCTKVKCV